MWLFGLDSMGMESSVALDEVTTPLSTLEGQALYGQNCVFCHGRRGEGGHNGMPLEGLAEFPTDYVSGIVRSGQNNMPSFAELLTADEINSIAEHVRTLNREIANRNRPQP